jgi:hypothetical protein
MRKMLLLAIVLALTTVLFADVTIGTGTAVQYYPFSSYYNYNRSAAIYLQSEIGSSMTIDRLQWYVSTANTTTDIPLKIYLKHTSAATQTAANWATLTADAVLVYEGTHRMTPVGWFEFNITDFAYNGVDNLMVLTESNGVAYVSPYPQQRYTSTSPNYRTLLIQVDGAPPTGNLSTSYNRPNITLVAAVTNPPNPAINPVPADLAEMVSINPLLSWASGGGSPDSYDVYFGTSDPPAFIQNQSVTTYSPATLAYSQQYYWQIVPRNGFGPAAGCPVWSFTTGPDPTIVAFPYEQSFDDTVYPPYGWNHVIGSGATGWQRSTGSSNPTVTPYAGVGMLYYNAYNLTGGSNASLISPPINADNASNMYTVSFWMYRDSAYLSNLDRVEVYVNSNPTPTGATLLGTVNRSRSQAPVVATAGWYQYTFELGIGAGDVKYAILKAISAYGNNMNVDEVSFNAVSIAVPPNPAHTPVPANLATNVAANTNLSWTSGGGAPTGFKVYTSLNGVDFTEVADVAVPLYDPAVNFAYSTQYFWKVDPYNSFGYASELVALPVWNFTTMADPVRPLPYLETFNASTSYPANWSGNFSITSSHGNASNGLYRNLWSSAPTGFVITAPVGPITENTRLDFEYRYVDYSSYPTIPTVLGAGNKLEIQVSINDGAYETYYTIDDTNHTPTTAFTTCSVYLSQAAKLANAGDYRQGQVQCHLGKR